jgi:hypothetical protein
MGIFGWSYPPGAANDPNAPYNQTDDGPCDVCGKAIDDCICPECDVCGETGNTECYDEHMVRTQQQIDSRAEAERQWTEQARAEAEAEAAYIEEQKNWKFD